MTIVDALVQFGTTLAGVLIGAQLAFKTQRLLSVEQDQRKAKFDQLATMRAVFGEYQDMWQSAFRDPFEERSERAAARQSFRTRVLFAFRDEAFAQAVVDSLVDVEETRSDLRPAVVGGPLNPRQPDVPFSDAEEAQKEATGRMLDAIQKLEAELGLAPIVMKPATQPRVRLVSSPTARIAAVAEELEETVDGEDTEDEQKKGSK